MDIITNVSRGNSFYVGSREFEIPELKLLVDAVSSSRFISAARSNDFDHSGIENSNFAEQTDFNNTLQGESFDDKNS